MYTINSLLNEGFKYLSQSSKKTSKIEAEILLSYVLNRDLKYLILNYSNILKNDQVNTFNKLLERRKLGEPIAYILKKKEFWKYNFYVDNSVMIPRPDSELIIEEIAEEEINTGIVNVFIKHTSASLTINENADPTVREDFETHFNKMVSEKENYFKHTLEGPDDMTSHIKSSVLGSSVNFPIKDGVPLLGVWQGIYLCEHRNSGKIRKIIITSYGEN